MDENTERILASKAGKRLSDPQEWRSAMSAAWERHPDPRFRELAEQVKAGASTQDLAVSYRDLLEKGLRTIKRTAT
ncbi:MAG TPA: hypothetical protein DGT23_25725 [Micromonosporaceae bacterium]|nr:hypothetical protein [Micromonosporaceae bacterium]